MLALLGNKILGILAFAGGVVLAGLAIFLAGEHKAKVATKAAQLRSQVKTVKEVQQLSKTAETTSDQTLANDLTRKS